MNMKRTLNITFFILLLFAPLFIYLELSGNYKNYDKIAAKYECYPVETCLADFNNDGNQDLITRLDNRKYGKYESRFVVYLKTDEGLKEILNLEYVAVDGSFRTHAAINKENEKAHLIIYDTVNPHQYFVWNGEKLIPTLPTLTDMEIRKAMSLNDDTGGFDDKIFFDFTAVFFSAIYYIIFFIIVTVVYFRNKTSNKLSLN